MSVPGIRKRATSDWGLKLLALAIAILLWASFHSEPAAEMTVQAPLEFRNVPHNLELAGDFPPTVRVRVRGRPTVLRDATPGQFAVEVDLSQATPGARAVHLSPSMIQAPMGTEVVRINPESVMLRLDARDASP